MKIHYLNLEIATERREWMECQARILDLDMRRVEAINAKIISDEDIARLKIPEAPGSVNLHAVLAVTLGHRNIWKIIAESDDPYCCVLEDDVVLSENSKAILSDLRWIPDDADIVKIETNFAPILGRRPPPTCYIDNIANRKFLVRKLVERHLGMAGYIIGRDACEKLLRTDGFDRNHIDLLLFCPKYRIRSDLNIYQIEPALCAQQQCVITQDCYARLSHRLPLSKKSYIFHDQPRVYGFKKVIREIKRIPKSSTRLLKKALARIHHRQFSSWVVEFDLDSKRSWYSRYSGG